MKKFKTMLAAFLCLVLPGWSLQAAVPELPLIVTSPVMKLDEPAGVFWSWEQLVLEDSEPAATVSPQIMQVLFPQSAPEVVPSLPGVRTIEGLSDTELEIQLQDELILEAEETGGRKSRGLRILGGILIVGGGIAMLLMLFSGGGSGSGSGSGEGSGSGSGSGGGSPSSIPPAGGGGAGGGGGGAGGAGGGAGGGGGGAGGAGGAGGGGAGGSGVGPNGFNPFNPGTVPNNPEPSTLFLLGLGLLLPFIRRKG